MKKLTILLFLTLFPAFVFADELAISNFKIASMDHGQLETKVYPGYNMSFDVAVISGFSEPQKPVMFEYSVINDEGQIVYQITEQRQIEGENVFTKKMMLPRNIEPGMYRLRIISTAQGKEIVREQHFEIEPSPIIKMKESNQAVLAGLFGQDSWLLGIMVIIVLVTAIIIGIAVLRKKTRTKAHRS